MAASQAPIEVTLRCSDHLDEYNTRTFSLRPGAIIHIGRASKNAAKPELMIGPTNAYIDSPTISREHAVLTATSPPAACVYLTDKASMHGTVVNGTKLEPHKAYRLNNGDVLQFGANVTREQLFYTARQFTFESSLPSYPHGFTVPESSDEEDAEVDQGVSCPPLYGTQANPLTIEDVDGSYFNDDDEVHDIRSNPDEDDEFDDHELLKHLQDDPGHLDVGQVAQEPASSPDAEVPVLCPVGESTVPATIHKFAFVEDASSEDEAGSVYSSDDEMVSNIDGGASAADSDESQSDGDMELEEHEESDDEELSLLEQQEKQHLLTVNENQASHPNAPEAHGSVTDGPASPKSREDMVGLLSKEIGTVRNNSSESNQAAPLALFAEPDSATQTTSQPEHLKVSASELRFEPYFTSNNAFGDPFDRACFDNMDAIPPRPTAPRSMQWGMLDYTSPFSPPTNTSVFPPACSPDILHCNYPGPVEPLLSNQYAAQQPYLPTPDNPWEASKSPALTLNPGVQTPPAAPSSEISSPPVRRTEVSIREIVEDIAQQPPTPTSVTGCLKRKAEVLDETSEGSDEEPSSPPHAPTSNSGPDSPVTAPESPCIAVDQRPKKRLRSRIGSAVKTAAAWVVPGVVGAAASVAFLTSVPNDFFVA